MEIYKRKSINDKLSKYTYLAKDNSSYIEITEWKNGEGWDIDIDDRKLFSLTFGELEAINYLVKALDIEQKD